VLNALSGRRTGPLVLPAEIVSRTLYAHSEKKKLRNVDALCSEVIAAFETRRQQGLVLRGYPGAAPARSVKIPSHLPLDFDFSEGTAKAGDIMMFLGVTVGIAAPDEAPGAEPLRQPAVSDVELETFCKGFIDRTRPMPSSAALWSAAQKQFLDKNVTRARVRSLVRRLFPVSQRKSGPRKK
jgi:hypothetical protein